jgi:glycosyltransferase involved in cell wall biosynthesis
MNRALERLGHRVDEIWASDLGRRIQHGNLHYLLELPRAYRSAVAAKCRAVDYDVIELNQPHAYLAAQQHKKLKRYGVFVNRSHGHEIRVEAVLAEYYRKYGTSPKSLLRRVASAAVRNLISRQWNLIARSSDGFVVSSTQDRDFVLSRYGVKENQVGVISQGVPTRLLATPIHPMSPARLARLLYVGQLAFVKAPMVVAEVTTKLLRSDEQRSMTWVCSANHHAHIRSLFPADVVERIRLHGHVSQDELIHVYDEHGVFLFPSFFEGFGKAPLEAMSRGLCVAASDVGGMSDFIRDGENGLLVPVGEPECMAERVELLLATPDVCHRMSAAAVQTAARHTWDWCAEECVSFYRRLLSVRERRSETRSSSQQLADRSARMLPS